MDDLKLSEKKKETAAAVIKAQQEESRKLTTLVRAELLLQMSDVLSEDDYKSFKTAMDRLPGVGERPAGPPGRPGGPGRGGPPRP